MKIRSVTALCFCAGRENRYNLARMWKDLYSYSGVVCVAFAATLWLLVWWARRRGANEMQLFASSRGYEYSTQIDPVELDLYSTSFFGRFDTAEGVLTGVLDGTSFSRFVQRSASGHGHKALSREIVTFEVGADTPDHKPTRCSDGFTMEVANGRAFLWRNHDDSDEDEELDQLLARAHAACELGIREYAAKSHE
ncbi:MAG TPA: hypothetical protein VN669_16300 [Candidatus Acidoferrales bacterium]|nr:hypothetical protein [Candidatus Acidoferrales bacterium]